MPTVGVRVKALRKALGLKQLDIVRALSLSKDRTATVSNWENDHRPPDRGTLRLLADLTSSPDEVFDWLCNNGPMPQIRSRPQGGSSGKPTGEAMPLSQEAKELLAWISPPAAEGKQVDASEVLVRLMRALGGKRHDN